MLTPNGPLPAGNPPNKHADGGTAYPLPAAAMASLFREEATHVVAREDAIRAKLAARCFDFDKPPPKPVPVLLYTGHTICTAGNLSVIQALMKAGKSGTLSAVIAAVVAPDPQSCDTLGFTSRNPHGFALLHFDTEQSPYDSDELIRRALFRAKRETPPPWLLSYCLTGFDIEEKREALRVALEDASRLHGGLFMVIIDGVADFLADPNDAPESFGLVDSLNSAAVAYDCPFLLVIHENQGSAEGKTRGHLGSQLARKVETSLRLHKDLASGITTVWADSARHCHIPRGEGLCFQWSNTAGMHVSCGSAREIRADAKRSKFADEAERAFGDEDRLSYTELVARIEETTGLSVKTAQKRVATYAAEGLIVKRDDGKYTLPSTLKLPSRNPSAG